MDDLKKRIERNDLIRSTLTGCRLDVSKGVVESGFFEEIISAVKNYDSFDKHNDVNDEHNFGVIFLDDKHTIFWFINPEKNTRCEKISKSRFEFRIQIMLDFEL
jgi:hypothetical protein